MRQTTPPVQPLVRHSGIVGEDCDSVKDAYVKALHLVNNDHHVTKPIK
jgi:hypothetical protein